MYISRVGIIALWLVVLAIFLAVRIVLGGDIGETICTFALIVATSIRFSFGSFGTDTNRIQNETGDESAPNQVDEAEQIVDSSDACDNAGSYIDQEAPSCNEDNNGAEQLVSEPEAEPGPSVNRFVYLDNVKIFLTMLVVTHHANCAFGGCGGSWFLIVGLNGPPAFERFLQTFTTLNQSFFMPLFFFISAYFVPTSFAKRGWNGFRQGKKKRILIPALFETFVITPVCVAIAASVAGVESPGYTPGPGVAWFLFWLLLFNWMYVTLVDETPSEEENKRNFPGTLQRLLYGAGVCGLLLLPLLILVPGSFASMPIAVGSFTCDFFMFYLGIQARNHDWLETSTTITYLHNQLDIHPILLFVMVVAEGTGMALLMPLVDEQSWVGFIFILLSGIFCLDMSLLVLVFFQRYANFETSVSKLLARAAYGVYLLHPFVLTSMTALYIFVYNKLPGIADPISFEEKPVGQGGEDHFGLGWMLVLLASHAIVWPFAYVLTRVPFLKNIL